MMEFYKENIKTVVREFNSSNKDGLDDGKIKLAAHKFGRNVLKAANPTSIVKILFRQFIRPLVFILIVASGVSFF